MSTRYWEKDDRVSRVEEHIATGRYVPVIEYNYIDNGSLLGWVTGPYLDGHWTARVQRFRQVITCTSKESAMAFVELMAL